MRKEILAIEVFMESIKTQMNLMNLDSEYIILGYSRSRSPGKRRALIYINGKFHKNLDGYVDISSEDTCQWIMKKEILFRKF